MKEIIQRGVRRAPIVLVAMSLLGAVLLSSAADRTAWADDVAPHQTPVDEKLAAAKDWYAAARVAWDAGTIRISDLYEASLAWKEAAVEAATTKQGRIKAIRAHLDRMVKLDEQVVSLGIASLGGGEADKEAMCRFWVLEAKIWVAEETARE
jgi:hypothetical protein